MVYGLLCMALFLLIIYWHQEGLSGIITGEDDAYLSDIDEGYDSGDDDKMEEQRFKRDTMRKDRMLNRYG